MTRARLRLTKSRHTRLSSSAWFCSASVSVVATVSTSTLSHSRRSQMRLSRVSWYWSAATSRCCAMCVSSSLLLLLAPALAVATAFVVLAPPPAPGVDAGASAPAAAARSSGSVSVYTKYSRMRNTGALMSWITTRPSLPSRMGDVSSALNTGDRASRIILWHFITSSSTTNSQSAPCPEDSSSPMSAPSEGGGTRTSSERGPLPVPPVRPDSAPPLDTTSSMVYLMMMVSLTRKPRAGSSRIARLTNLR
mmetsp:Transcript_27470/g.69858  ORF Transcript_27470/g.69858 Transcript_27470/m.69858 type:complete len:250 (-) Transcript_27470:836-1585(-)